LPILARILRDRGIVTERQLQEAIQRQVLYGGRLGTSLYELGFITEESLRDALARAHGVPTMAIDVREIQPEAIAVIPKAVAARYKVFPYRIKGKTLFLLMINPNDHATVASVGYSFGYILKPLVVPEFRMIQLLRDYYGIDERWRFDDTHRPPVLPPPPTDAKSAVAQIDHATTRDEVVSALVALCHRYFRRVIFFIVREPWVMGWTGVGPGMDRSVAATLKVPLDQPSVFQTVTRDKTVFLGRFGPEEANQGFLKAVRKRANTNAALIPIGVKGHVVNLVYGDAGPEGNIKANLGELMVLVQKVSRAYLRIIRERLAETRRAETAAIEREES
jgi:MshEN domain